MARRRLFRVKTPAGHSSSGDTEEGRIALLSASPYLPADSASQQRIEPPSAEQAVGQARQRRPGPRAEGSAQNLWGRGKWRGKWRKSGKK